jgi:hypothetical protein
MEVAKFIRECVEYAGGLADEPESGLVETLMPEGLRAEFGQREEVLLALDPDAAVRHPDAIPALPGSQALDVFVRFGLQQGRLTHAWPRADLLKPRSIAGDIVYAMKFTAGRVRLPEDEAAVEQASVAQFDFIVTLASDEKEESLHSVVIDLWTGLPCSVLSGIAARLETDPAGPSAGKRVCLTVAQAYEAARATLQKWMEPRITRHQALVTRRLRDEWARMKLYYRGMVEDLERRTQRAGGSGERAGALREKIAATREEEAVKLAELAEKYRLRPSARLTAARVLTYPRLFATVMLDRKQTSRALELCWDPLIGRLRLPACENCRQETAHLELYRDDRLLCPACAAQVRK